MTPEAARLVPRCSSSPSRCRSSSASYRVSQFTLVLSYAVAVLGLNLLLGYSGQISLGHGAFFALGAYVTAVLVGQVGLAAPGDDPGGRGDLLRRRLRRRHPGAATARPLPRAGDARARGGDAAADQALRRRSPAARRDCSVPPPAVPGWLGFCADDQWLYLLNLAITVPMFVLAAGIVRGRVGRALVAMRDNQIAAQDVRRRPRGVQDARVRDQRRLRRRGRLDVRDRDRLRRARVVRLGAVVHVPGRDRRRRRRRWPARSSGRCSSSSCRSTPRTSTRRSRP